MNLKNMKVGQSFKVTGDFDMSLAKEILKLVEGFKVGDRYKINTKELPFGDKGFRKTLIWDAAGVVLLKKIDGDVATVEVEETGKLFKIPLKALIK